MCPVKYYIKQFNLKLRPAQESGTVTDTGKVSQLSSMCVTGECTGNCGHPQKAKWQGGTVVVGNYNLFLHNIFYFFLLSLSLTFSPAVLDTHIYINTLQFISMCLCFLRSAWFVLTDGSPGHFLLISTSWKWVIIKGKVWGATQSVLIDLWQWCNKKKRTRESSVLEHTQNMICFSTCSSDPAHFGTPAGSSNSPVKPIESRQEGVRSLKMLPCELSSREIILREMHIKHYQDGCLILQGVLFLKSV